MLSSAVLAASFFAPVALAANYSLIAEYAGSNFFDSWTFYNYYDNTTSGDIVYVNASYAASVDLAYVNDAGQAIVKVDNTSFVPWNDKRDSVRITTADYFTSGSVILFDASHIPYGCSIWPSFWTMGEDWPSGGEIDILEGINEMTANQMALHTDAGCSATSGSYASGTLGETDCNSTTGSGCTYGENQANSYGEAFASAGGGVWATLFDYSGIAIWFWSRPDVPSSVSTADTSIDISSWGEPSANFSSQSCDLSEFFAPQQIVIDITMCGDWAGVPSIYEETCSIEGGNSVANASSCYLQNVDNYGNQTALATAYFAINYVKVFNANSTLLDSSGVSTSVAPTASIVTAGVGSSGGSASSTAGASSASGTTGSGGSSSGGAKAVSSNGAGLLVFCITALSAWTMF